MYSNVVLGLDHHMFEEILDDHKDALGVTIDTELTRRGLASGGRRLQGVVERETGKPFPQEPQEQLWGAIGAVFDSWMNPRASSTAACTTSRRLGHGGERAVDGVRQHGRDCATGVAFTRNPSTGDNEFYGEFLINAQGEDVVAGIRTPQHLTARRQEGEEGAPSMEEAMPEVFGESAGCGGVLERHYRDMQDIEFTVERGRLYMLQTRNGKRTAKAALKIAVDTGRRGLITARRRCCASSPARSTSCCTRPSTPRPRRTVLTRGLPASPGAATGKIVFSAEEAEPLAAAGEAVILVRTRPAPRTSTACTPPGASSPPAAA